MEMCGTVTLYGSDLYKQYEAKYGSKHNRKCIDGKITGCGNCVGFCKYSGHPGFLTSKMRERHGCINKGCFYYVGKPARICEKKESSTFQDTLLAAAKRQTAAMEGMKILTVTNDGLNHWRLNYVTITNEYSLKATQDILESELGCMISFKKLNYSFDICAQLIMAD